MLIFFLYGRQRCGVKRLKFYAGVCLLCLILVLFFVVFIYMSISIIIIIISVIAGCVIK